MGPELPSDELVHQITNEVLEFLSSKNKWNLQYSLNIAPTIFDHRHQVVACLEQAIKECIFQKWCEDF